MESRREKYYKEELEENNNSSRSSRNARLYREVYGRYEDLDNLPIEDNTDEIDMDTLREIVSNINKKENKTPPNGYNLDILETKKRNIDEQKVYDINKLLEKAKYENSKLKEPESNLTKTSRNILSTLESTELSVEEIKEACKKYENKKIDVYPKKETPKETETELSMTREMKYHTKQISLDPLIEQVMPNDDLSLDLLSDLKPTGNTIVTKPIKESDYELTKTPKTDTSDIDIIKKEKDMDTDFFTSSYHFSKRDFANDDDDFLEKPKSHNALKVILLILAILIFAGVIFYFVKTYGMGV